MYTKISIIPSIKVIWFLVYISFYELTASNFEHILLVSHLFCTKIFKADITVDKDSPRNTLSETHCKLHFTFQHNALPPVVFPDNLL